MKSRFARKIFIKDVIDFANSTGFKVKIFLNSLEESVEKVTSTLVASELYNLFGIKDTGYYNLTNTGNTPSSDEYMKQVKKACEEVDRKYGSTLDIIHQNDPLKFYLRIRDYLKEVGSFYDAEFKDGIVVNKKEVDKGTWNYYEYKEPTIIIAVSDTIDKYQPTELHIGNVKKQLNKYESVRYFSEVFSRQRLGLVCDVVSVQISQQNEDNLKANTDFRGDKDIWKIKPNLGNLLTVRAIGQDATLAFGLFNPTEHHIFDYLGYDKLDKMKNNAKFRSLIVMKTREGDLTPPANEIGMACFFNRDHFEELPKPDDPKVWNYFEKEATSGFNVNKKLP